MAALTANTPRVFIETGDTVFQVRKVSANVRIYTGALLGIDDATGLCRPFTDGDAFAGIAEGEVNNLTGTPLGGGAGAMEVLVRAKGLLRTGSVAGTPAATKIGDAVYCSTSGDFSMTDSGSDTVMGVLSDYYSATDHVVSFKSSLLD